VFSVSVSSQEGTLDHIAPRSSSPSLPFPTTSLIPTPTTTTRNATLNSAHPLLSDLRLLQGVEPATRPSPKRTRLGGGSDAMDGDRLADTVDTGRVHGGSTVHSARTLRAHLGDVARVTARVAGLALSASVRALARGVTHLAASIALLRHSLTIPSVVVGTSALEARRHATRHDAYAAAACKGRPDGASAGPSNGSRVSGRVRALTSPVTNVTAVEAPALRATTTHGAGTDAKAGALLLNVAHTLAGVALLGLRATGLGAGGRLVARLLAVVAQPLRRDAGLCKVTNVAALVARTTRQRHIFLVGGWG